MEVDDRKFCAPYSMRRYHESRAGSVVEYAWRREFWRAADIRSRFCGAWWTAPVGSSRDVAGLTAWLGMQRACGKQRDAENHFLHAAICGCVSSMANSRRIVCFSATSRGTYRNLQATLVLVYTERSFNRIIAMHGLIGSMKAVAGKRDSMPLIASFEKGTVTTPVGGHGLQS